MTRAWVALLCLVAGLGAAAVVFSAGTTPPVGHVFYVAAGPTGSDSNPGTKAAPWASIQHAVDHTPDGAVVRVANGTYDSFRITHPLTVRGASRDGVVVTSSTAADLIEVAAGDSTVAALTVAGCVPEADPAGGIDDHPHSGIRVDDGADDVAISGVTVRDGSVPLDATHRLGCHGIFLHGADRVTVSHSWIHGNGSGIYVVDGGRGDLLTSNVIHDNTALIRNTPVAVDDDDDFGAVGIGFDGVTDEPGPVAEHNAIARNRGASYDYGTDGGGFEIFEASHVVMRHNTIVANDGILETGTSSPDLDCAGNVFTGNTTRGTASGRPGSTSTGMVLRCAAGMVISDNTIRDADEYAFSVGGTDAFSSSIDGLTITGNRVAQTYGPMFISTVDPRTWGATIDRNGYSWQCQQPYRFAGPLDGSLARLDQWQRVTPYDDHSTATALGC